MRNFEKSTYVAILSFPSVMSVLFRCWNDFLFQSSEEEEIGLRTDLGLKIGLAYHVTDVRKVYLGESGLRTLFK